MGNKFLEKKFRVTINPFGILYNPASIATALNRIVEGTPYSASELIASEGLYHSLDHHGRFSGSNPELVLSEINRELSLAQTRLKQADFLFITPGTAQVFLWKASGRVAGNCHKLPAGQFETAMLSVGEATSLLSNALERVVTMNPQIKLIFTLSPVRYIKGGAHQSQTAKATLLLALNELCNHFSARSFYFPAYEIMLDELRDYRFYAEDMIHPSEIAVSYLFHKVAETMIEEESLKLSHEIDKLCKACGHRLLNPSPGAVSDFATGQLHQIAALKERCLRYGISLAREESYFGGLLSQHGNQTPSS